MSTENASDELKTETKAPKLKKIKKTTKSEDVPESDPKKASTKEMITEALKQLKSRKGASLYAIKKYVSDTYKIDVEKYNHFIKKALKTGVEAGSIIQTKGIGASGSFRLAPIKPEKKPSKPKPEPKNAELKKSKDKKETTQGKKTKGKEKKAEKTVKDVKETKQKESKINETPVKKKTMMKRKSIGKIIKPPKMRPKAK